MRSGFPQRTSMKLRDTRPVERLVGSCHLDAVSPIDVLDGYVLAGARFTLYAFAEGNLQGVGALHGFGGGRPVLVDGVAREYALRVAEAGEVGCSG